jgi:UDP-N-acetyl-D-galactosamine dehydrogenase
VPTPVKENQRPDLSPLRVACQAVGQVISKGDLVIIESTVYPGVTEEICMPLIASISGLEINKDFHCGYSPERVNPADHSRSIRDIKKITAGSSPEAAERTDTIYREVITAGTHRAPSIQVAEAAKVIENTQRDVNIALMNELTMICHSLQIDATEVFSAAASKWNFLNFVPGLVGGHCIGVDPYYLCHKAQISGYQPNLVLAARQVNDGMGRYVAENTLRLIGQRGLRPKCTEVLILGFTFKEDCPDPRNSRVNDIRQILIESGCDVRVCDPIADKNKTLAEYGFAPDDDWQVALAKKPAVIIFAVAHRCFADIDVATVRDALVIDVKGIAPRADWRL